MKIIVLSVAPYKEKDGIVSALSEEGYLSFLARGILDPKGKNNGLNTPLSIADIDLIEDKGKYPSLKGASSIQNPMKSGATYDDMIALQFIIESTNNLLMDEEKGALYSDLLLALDFYKNGGDPYSLMLLYIARVLSLSGYEFEINHCLMCGGKKNIATFSFTDGGFLCQNCLTVDTPRDFNKSQLLLMRYIFGLDEFVNIPSLDKDDAITILQKIGDFVLDSYGYKLRSIALLIK